MVNVPWEQLVSPTLPERETLQILGKRRRNQLLDLLAGYGKRHPRQQKFNQGKSSFNDQAWFRSVTKVELTDISACGRIVFHILWCSNCVSLYIRSRFRV